VSGGAGGVARGTPELFPLLGGCSGGHGGGWNSGSVCSATPQTVGAGGGAIQLSVAGTLAVTGTLLADGGGGVVGCDPEGGASGGGSGGAILLEASVIDTASATLRARGGNGGVSPAGPAGGLGSTSASSNGASGMGSLDGGSGGGGGYGRIAYRDCLAP
jgi:hypothetical protein